MAAFSVRYYSDETKKTTMTTQVHGNSEREAKERFKSTHPRAVIIEFRQIGN